MNHPFLKKIQGKHYSSKDENIENIASPEKENLSSFKHNTFIEENSSIQNDNEFLEKILTSEEKLLMQLSLEKEKTSILTIEKLSIILQSKKLVIQNYELRIKQLNNEINIITEQIKQNQDILKNIKEDHMKLNEILSDKYTLQAGWKFDPETGKIM